MKGLNEKGHPYGVYSVYDKKGEFFDTPFFCRTDLFAKRRFIMDVRDRKDSMLYSFKEDFELMRLCAFNPNNGTFEVDVELIMKGREIEE